MQLFWWAFKEAPLFRPHESHFKIASLFIGRTVAVVVPYSALYNIFFHAVDSLDIATINLPADAIRTLTKHTLLIGVVRALEFSDCSIRVYSYTP